MKTKTTKVYCKDCKYWAEEYYSYHPLSWLYPYCSFKIFKKNKEISKITGQERGEHTEVDYKKANKNNNCSYYKRKWYKFWL